MDNQQFVRFDRDMTSIIKGFAIIFMMLVHCYWHYDDVAIDYSDSLLANVNDVFAVSVSMFTFLVGYGYNFSKNKDLEYSIKHIKKLLIPFWIVLFVFTFPVCWTEVKEYGIRGLLYNLIGIDSHFNWYSWFVYFFIYAMIVMPFLARFINRRPVRHTAIIIVASVALSVIIHEIPQFVRLFGISMPRMVEIDSLLALYNTQVMTPCMVLGYLFANQGYYERINIGNISKLWTFLICLIVIVLFLVIRHFGTFTHIPFKMDFFYVPFIIGSIVVLFNKFRWNTFRRIMIKMGEVSVYMWFLHALFFTPATKSFYQPILSFFRVADLTVAWTIVLTFFASWLIKTVVDACQRWLSKLVTRTA